MNKCIAQMNGIQIDFGLIHNFTVGKIYEYKKDMLPYSNSNTPIYQYIIYEDYNKNKDKCFLLSESEFSTIFNTLEEHREEIIKQIIADHPYPEQTSF